MACRQSDQASDAIRDGTRYPRRRLAALSLGIQRAADAKQSRGLSLRGAARLRSDCQRARVEHGESPGPQQAQQRNHFLPRER